jgi:hypothetical protein
VLFEPLQDSTLDLFSNHVNVTATNVTTFEHLTPYGQSQTILSNISLSIMWLATLCVFWVLPPIVLTTLVGFIGYFRGWYLRVNRIITWKDVVKVFGTKETLKLFRKKLMNLKGENRGDDARVEWSFALVWNEIVQSFYDNHQCSQNEFQRLTFPLKPLMHDDGTMGYRILGHPDLSKEPKNKDMVYQFCRFFNNLYMPSLPGGSNILDMKRLVIFTPVYREKIFYTWDELVKPGNTDSSFLRALIIKFSSDWNNFKQKEFPKGSRLRHTIDYLESKILAGIDISAHIVHGRVTTKFLQKLICRWASQRFQPVARTVTGFINVPRALSILLRIQNPSMTETEVKKVIRQKFSYVIGAQLYDRKYVFRFLDINSYSMWDMSTGYSKANAATKAALEIEHKEYTKGLKYLCKQVGDIMLKVAYLKRDDDGKWTGILTTWDSDIADMSNLYEIPSLGNFAELGQVFNIF